MKRLIVAFALSLVIALESTAQPLVSPEPALRPNRPHRLIEQNRIARAAGFQPLTSVARLSELRERGVFIEISDRGRGYYLNLGLSHALAVPEVGEFLVELSATYADSFPGSALKITSVTRTMRDHRRLQRRVPSAASCVTPERCSPHLYGLTFDVSKRPMSARAVRWMRRALVSYQVRGRIDAFEEMYGNNFHILVIPAFALTKANQ